jgi:hypothetical protein
VSVAVSRQLQQELYMSGMKIDEGGGRWTDLDGAEAGD